MTIKGTSRKITISISEIESKVHKKLMSFYNSFIKPHDGILPASTLRDLYEDRVKSLIRKTVQDAYSSGMEIVNDEVNKKKSFDTFISTKDISNIRSLTEKLNDDYWKEIDRLVTRQSESKFEDGELVPKPEFDVEASMASLASYFSFRPLNTAIISKTEEAVLFLNATEGGSIPTEFAEDFFPEPTEVFNLDLTQLGGRIMFLTKEDEKVDDEICEPLNRTDYEVTDPTIPLPPLHRYCRCRLVPLFIGQEAEDFIPEQFAEL